MPHRGPARTVGPDGCARVQPEPGGPDGGHQHRPSLPGHERPAHPSVDVLQRLHEVLFAPTQAELVAPVELKVMGWKQEIRKWNGLESLWSAEPTGTAQVPCISVGIPNIHLWVDLGRNHQKCGSVKRRCPPQSSLIPVSKYIGMFLNLVRKSPVISDSDNLKSTVL